MSQQSVANWIVGIPEWQCEIKVQEQIISRIY